MPTELTNELPDFVEKMFQQGILSRERYLEIMKLRDPDYKIIKNEPYIPEEE